MNGPRLSKAQRMILIFYCVALAYCCLWIPWRVPQYKYGINDNPIDYTWLWSGPYLSVPDVPVIILRIVVASALAGAAFLIAGQFSK